MAAIIGLGAVAWVFGVDHSESSPAASSTHAMPAVIGMENRAAKTAIKSAIPDASVIEFDDSDKYETEHQCLWTLPSGAIANHLDGGFVVSSAEYLAGTQLKAGAGIDIRVVQPPDAVCVPIEKPAGSSGSTGSLPHVDVDVDFDKPYICRHTRWC